jgi:hypothetical protein
MLRLHAIPGESGQGVDMIIPQAGNGYMPLPYSVGTGIPLVVTRWTDAIGQPHYSIKFGPGMWGLDLSYDRNRGVLPVSKGGTGASALAAEITAESTDLEVPTAKAVYELFKSLI